MKKVIDGFLYDTDKAEEIGSYYEDVSDYAIKKSVIYRQHNQLFVYWKITSWKEEGIYLIGEQKENKESVQDYKEYWEED